MLEKVAYCIVAAQSCSDEGKNEKYGYIDVQKKNHNYCGKDIYIRNAINLINKNKNKDRDIKYYVTIDKQKRAKYIVYFDFNLFGRRLQVSFHSFDKQLEKYADASKASKTSWKNYQNSRNNCYEIAKAFGFYAEVYDGWEE